MSYLPVELHCHTIHSDGDFTPEALQKAAVSDRLSLIALTDHNTFTGTEELDEKIIPFIKGIEWTTYFGHMLVLGAKSFVDWRDAVPNNIDEKISAVKAVGGIVGVAHPYQCGSPICTGGRWEFNVEKWEHVDYIEIWHEAFHDGNTENDRATAMWTSLLDKGCHLAASYGKDWHRPQKENMLFGCTYLDFDGKVNAENALRAIQNGRTVVSVGASFSFTILCSGREYRIGDTVPSGKAEFNFIADYTARKDNSGNKSIEYKTIRLVTNGGAVVCEISKDTGAAEIEIKEKQWYRAELWGRIDGREQPLAITSPIYTE